MNAAFQQRRLHLGFNQETVRYGPYRIGSIDKRADGKYQISIYVEKQDIEHPWQTVTFKQGFDCRKHARMWLERAWPQITEKYKPYIFVPEP